MAKCSVGLCSDVVIGKKDLAQKQRKNKEEGKKKEKKTLFAASH